MNRKELIAFVLAVLALGFAQPGGAEAVRVRVEVRNNVDTIRSLPISNLEKVLVDQILAKLKMHEEFQHWDFGGTVTSNFRLVLEIVPGRMGKPRGIDLNLNLFNGTEPMGRGWNHIVWRRPGYTDGFGTLQDIAEEIITALAGKSAGGETPGPLTPPEKDETAKPLTVTALGDLLLEVPVGSGLGMRRVKEVTGGATVVTSLTEDRHQALRYSTFKVHCTAERTWMLGTGRDWIAGFIPPPQQKGRATAKALEVEPFCLYDDVKRGRTPKTDDNLTDLVPDAVYLKYFIKKYVALVDKLENCE